MMFSSSSSFFVSLFLSSIVCLLSLGILMFTFPLPAVLPLSPVPQEDPTMSELDKAKWYLKQTRDIPGTLKRFHNLKDRHGFMAEKAALETLMVKGSNNFLEAIVSYPFNHSINPSMNE